MAKVTIGFAVALIALGIGGYVPHHAKTALIPAYVGGAMLLLGMLALKQWRRKHAMHAAAAIASLGFLASAGRLLGAIASGDLPSPVATASLGGMALLTLVFVLLCVRSFVAARGPCA